MVSSRWLCSMSGREGLGEICIQFFAAKEESCSETSQSKVRERAYHLDSIKAITNACPENFK